MVLVLPLVGMVVITCGVQYDTRLELVITDSHNGHCDIVRCI